MILDASVAIALRSSRDVHAERARSLVLHAAELVIHPVTLAETLVVPARAGIADLVRARLLEGLGIRLWEPDVDEPLRVAELRAQVGVALPDCYVLALAEQTGLPVASFDKRLVRAAMQRGRAIATDGTTVHGEVRKR